MKKCCKVLLTADAIMMSNCGNSLFYGFLASAPAKLNRYLSSGPFLKIIFDRTPENSQGRAILAPQGLRRVESSLLQSAMFTNDEVIVAQPDKLDRFISDCTKIIGISAIDPFGRGPASSTFAGEYGLIHSEPVNSYSFRKLIRSSAVQEARKRGVKVIVGGPGAWQFTTETMESCGIDAVVDGESDLLFSKIVRQVMYGNLKTPAIIKADFSSAPEAEQIPPLCGGTIGGVVEISRGCGRGCKFCMPTMRMIRHRPVVDVIRDVEFNVKQGETLACLHAEDVLRYGSFRILPEAEKVVTLFKQVKAVEGVTCVCVSHAAMASIAVAPALVAEISEILELDRHNWMGFQTGIETGSPRLVQSMMNMKPAPYKPSEWQEVVERAFSICHDNDWVPAATLVVNLPGETEQDVIKTTELVDKLRDYKSFIVPLLFVPFKNSCGNAMRIIEDADYYHFELYRSVWRHNIRWIKELAWHYARFNSSFKKLAIKALVGLLTGYVNGRVERYLGEKIALKKVNASISTKAIKQYLSSASPAC